MDLRTVERYLVRGVLFLLLAFWSCACLGAGESAEKSDSKAEREDVEKKKKIPPFKCSAWCSFRSFMDVERYDPEKLKQSPTYKEEVDDQTRYGSGQWGGFARRGQWVSIVVEVQNTTEDTPYQGNIRVQLDPSKEGREGVKPYTTRYRQEFELAPKTTQSYYFSVLCPEFDFSAVHVTVATQARTYERDVGLYELDSAREDLIVVVSDRAAAFKFLTKRAGDEHDTGRDQGPIGRRVAVVQPADLPNRWYNLTLANLIVIDGPPREGLNDEQIEALRGYSQTGGQVLISSGVDPARLRAPDGRALSLADLAGIRVRELSRVKRLDLAPAWLLSEKDEGLSVIDVTPIHEGGTVQVFRNGQTALVERLNRQVGLGGVSFLAFSLSDEKLKTWPHRDTIPLLLIEKTRRRGLFAYQERSPSPQQPWMDVEDEDGRAPRDAVEQLREKLDGSFSRDTPVETPKRGVVASLLLLYLLVAVPLNYFIFGWFRRREIAWAAVPVWALFFSIGAYVVGFQQGRLTVDQLSVVEAGADQEEGMTRTFMSVYAPRFGNYRLEFEPGNGAGIPPQPGPGHLVSRGFKTRGITSLLPEMDVLEQPNGDLVVEKLQILARATRRLEVQHRTGLGKGLHITLNRDDAGKANVEVRNGTPFHLINAVLAFKGLDSNWRGVRLGTGVLTKGVTQPFSVSMGPRDGQELKDLFFSRPPPRSISAGGGQITVDRAQSLGAFVQTRLDRYHQTVLLAWVDGGSLPVKILRGVREMEDVERGMTMLLVPVGDRVGGGSLNWSGRFTTDPGRLDRAEWESFSVKSGGVRILQADAQKGLTHVDLRAPQNVHDLQERDFSLSCKMRFLTQQEFNQRSSTRYNYYNNAPSMPTALSGELTVEIARWKADLTLDGSGWRKIHSQLFNQMKPGERFAISFNGKLEREELGPEGRILLRVGLARMSLKGPWAEVDWPLELLEFQPKVTGRSEAR